MSAIISQIIRRKIATSSARLSNAAVAGDHSGKLCCKEKNCNAQYVKVI